MTPKEVFEMTVSVRLKEKGDAVTKINAVYQFFITGDQGGTWWVDTTKSGGEVGVGERQDARCTITMGDKDFIDMVGGKLNAQMAFMTGKLKVKGDMGLALKLGSVLGL